MAFEIGTASTPADLFGKLAAFAGANGWTVTNVSGGGKHFAKGAINVALAAGGTTLSTRACDGLTTGAAFDAQPNNSGQTHLITLGAGPFSGYTAYSSAESGAEQLHLVVEVSAGIYRHWTAGQLVKFGTWTGGQYTDSTELNPIVPAFVNYPYIPDHRYLFDSEGTVIAYGQVRADIDSKTNNWMLLHAAWSGNRAKGDVRRYGLHGTLVNGAGWQRWNLLTPVFPIVIALDRQSSLRSIAGRVPNMRSVNMRNLSPGQVLNIGGVDWQCWPMISRTDAWSVSGSTVQSSGYVGIAIKRV